MSVRDIDVAKLYEELMAFDRYLEKMEPSADDSSRPPGSRPVSFEIPAPNGTEPAGDATSSTPGGGGGDNEEPAKQHAVGRRLEGEKMTEVRQQILRAVQSTIGLIIILLAYSFLGAAILSFTESFQEMTNFELLNETKRSVIADIIRNITLSVPCNCDGKTADESPQNFNLLPSRHNRDANTTANPFGEGSDLWLAVDRQLTKYTEAKESLRPYSGSPGWTFWGALFYCGTVYTTVGYGNVYPLTTDGRVITIIYGIIGIPLCLVVLMNLGKTFTHAVKFLWSFVRRFYYTGSFRRVRCMIPAGRLRMTVFQRFKHSIRRQTHRIRARSGGFRRRNVAPPIEGAEGGKPEIEEEEECVPFDVDDTFNLPPVIALLIAFVYMLLGSALYTIWETDWTFFDAFYFVFISLSTIGLGDVVPKHPKYFLLTAFYLFIGLALVAMVINVFMERMNLSMSKAAARFDEKTVERIVQRLRRPSSPDHPLETKSSRDAPAASGKVG